MVKQIYEVVEHNGGFAYRVGDVYSETFATHEAAHEAAEEAVRRHQLRGQDQAIEYQDREGKWHEELARGDVRPGTEVQDPLPEDLEARGRRGERLDEDELPNPDRAPIADIKGD